MDVYFISGLGADRRMFKNIQLPIHCNPIYLDWITPLEKESLNQYALRLSKNINSQQPFALIGLSMGGMVAAEMAQFLRPERTILISSVPSYRHLPFYFKTARILKIHKVVPMSLIRSFTILKHLFSSETEEDKIMLRQIIQQSNDKFTRWAIDAIVNWKNDQLPPDYIHIHGSRDEILPVRLTKPTHLIKNAGHLMVMNRAKEVNFIIAALLADVS